MKTKKLLHTVELLDGKKVRKEFLIPSPQCDALIGIKFGKEYSHGMICFTGKEVTPSDLFEKAKENKVNTSLTVLESFLSELTSFKIGNVLTLNEKKESLLKKTHERPPSKSKALP